MDQAIPEVVPQLALAPCEGTAAVTSAPFHAHGHPVGAAIRLSAINDPVHDTGGPCSKIGLPFDDGAADDDERAGWVVGGGHDDSEMRSSPRARRHDATRSPATRTPDVQPVVGTSFV